MKTSLNIDDHIYELAQKESVEKKKTLSEVISFWARMGHELSQKEKKDPQKRGAGFKPADVGLLMDINCRREWMDKLDELDGKL